MSLQYVSPVDKNVLSVNVAWGGSLGRRAGMAQRTEQHCLCPVSGSLADVG